MRLLMLKEALGTGGAERQLALIMSNLPPYWERRAWVMEGGPFADAIVGDGCAVDVCPRRARFDVAPALPLWRLLLTWRPDVVHSWDWMSTFAALPVCRALRIPIVDTTIRDGAVVRRGPLRRRVSQAASTLVVANSRAGLEAWGVPPRKGRVVYNAFDPARLDVTDASAARATDGGGRHTVVMTARMVVHKDFSSLIAVARRLDRDRPGRWRFLLLGDGPDKPRLMAEAGELQGRGVVEFIDPGVEAMSYVRRADVGVLMSNETEHQEGCSNAIMEYMSVALPVVCSSGGGNPELVLDGQTGHLVPNGDADALASALARLADDPDEARRLGEAGRRRILEEFTIDRLVRKTEQIYWEAMARRSA